MLHSIILKFSGQNTLYFRLSTNDKIAQTTKSSFLYAAHHCSPRIKSQFIFLLSPKYTIFRSEKLHSDRCNIVYIMVFFLIFFERFEFELLELEILGSMELELQTSTLLCCVFCFECFHIRSTY
jgi:hypothetical protein